jgi:Fe-S-cluster-containing dehydrogenase component
MSGEWVKRYGLVIDLERCIGCHACTVACKVECGMEAGSGVRVETVGGAHQDTPAGNHPELSMYYLPVVCMHCERPPCLDACPQDAIERRPDGIVIIDEERCNACQDCLAACPYDALSYDPDRGTVQKCNLCVERLEQGFEPFCALCCGPGAILWGDVADPGSKVSQLISQRKAYSLKPELDTGPAVYYCPPMERRQA